MVVSPNKYKKRIKNMLRSRYIGKKYHGKLLTIFMIDMT